MKSNLNCLVSNCTYNDKGYCYASYIKINGLGATNSKQTFCDTYREGSLKSITSASDINLTNSQDIICSAKNCTYNICGGCCAGHVLINRNSNECDTFRIKN